jgi:hypothetical protein
VLEVALKLVRCSRVCNSTMLALRGWRTQPYAVMCDLVQCSRLVTDLAALPCLCCGWACPAAGPRA